MILIKDADLGSCGSYFTRSTPLVREVSMIRLVTRGRLTHDYLKGLLGAPEDRETAVRKVVEAVKSSAFTSRLAKRTSCSFRRLTRLNRLSPRSWRCLRRVRFPMSSL